jgi:hypothetical protein
MFYDVKIASHCWLLKAQVLQIPAGSRKVRYKMGNTWNRSHQCFLYLVFFIVYLISPGLSADNRWRPQHSYAFELKSPLARNVYSGDNFCRSVVRYATYDHITNKEIRTKHMQLNGTTVNYTSKRIHLLGMNNTPILTFGHDQIPTGKKSVSRRKKIWRNHTHEDGTSLDVL